VAGILLLAFWVRYFVQKLLNKRVDIKIAIARSLIIVASILIICYAFILCNELDKIFIPVVQIISNSVLIVIMTSTIRALKKKAK
jgi:hypothetical protein